MERENIAIIDLGTNTFHCLIVEIRSNNEYVVKHKFKEMVKLGEGGIDSETISEPSFKRGLEALKKFQLYISQNNINKTIAIATSAIRTAKNGDEFVKKAKEDTGIEIRVINGNEEAAYIYEGVRNGVQLSAEEPILIMDIGGGSVEFIVATNHNAFLIRSLKLGASRIIEKFKPSDPITPNEILKIESYYKKEIGTLLEEIKEFKVTKIVGSSGSFETVGLLLAHEKHDSLTIENLNGYRFNIEDFKNIYEKIILSNRDERILIPGMDKQRVDLIVVASILINLVSKELKTQQLTVSEYALKDGLLHNYIVERQHGLGAHNPKERNIREKAVLSMFKKYECQEKHTDTVLKIALAIFDQTQSLHWYGDLEREWLNFAVLLHDVGYFINRSGHHKHGQYLIMNSQLPGFSADELLILGNMVRYHRKSVPSKDHIFYQLLTPEHKILVRKLAAILRIADHLDKGHRHLIQDIRVTSFSQSVEIEVIASDDVSVELEYALKEKELFEEAFKTKLILRQSILVR